MPRSDSGASIADRPSVRAMTTKSGLPRSSATARIIRSLPIISVGGHERLAADVAAALGQHLVLEVGGGDAGGDVQLGRALDVEDVPVARVHVDDDRRDVEVPGRHALLGIAHGGRQLELAQGG